MVARFRRVPSNASHRAGVSGFSSPPVTSSCLTRHVCAAAWTGRAAHLQHRYSSLTILKPGHACQFCFVLQVCAPWYAYCTSKCQAAHSYPCLHEVLGGLVAGARLVLGGRDRTSCLWRHVHGQPCCVARLHRNPGLRSVRAPC
jgi:hypothetical protein